jgi:pterin-4a-carbinolamine dehydratase
VHFQQWADRVGIADPISTGAAKPGAKHHPKLDNPVVYELVKCSLESMKVRPNPSESTLKDLEMADIDDNILLPPVLGGSGGGAKMAS